MSRSINFNPLRRPSDTSAGAQPARKTAAHGHDSDQPHRAAGIVIASCISRSSSQAMRFAPGGSLAPCPYTHRRARPASTARMSRPEIAHVRGWSRGPLGFPRSMVDAEELPVFRRSQTHAHRHRWAARVVLGRPRPEITFLPASRERPSHARTTVPDYPVLVWIATR